MVLPGGVHATSEQTTGDECIPLPPAVALSRRHPLPTPSVTPRRCGAPGFLEACTSSVSADDVVCAQLDALPLFTSSQPCLSAHKGGAPTPGVPPAACPRAVSAKVAPEPLAQPLAQPVDAPAADPRVLLAGKRVLYADDEAVNRAVGQRMLERLGCVPTVVTDGVEVVPALADGAEVHAILLDIQMKTLDGDVVCRELRARGETRPIIALTGAFGTRSSCTRAHMTRPGACGCRRRVPWGWAGLGLM